MRYQHVLLLLYLYGRWDYLLDAICELNSEMHSVFGAFTTAVWMCAFGHVASNDGRRLVMVQAIFRHGDRAPSKSYPNDPYADFDTYWPRGKSQLTLRGMQQTFELGQYFRSRYVSDATTQRFLQPEFDRNEVYIQSSNADRALESAQAMAHGMFPAEGDHKWSEQISWQPIPVHAIRRSGRDMLLKPTSVDCPIYDKVADRENAPVFERLNEEYADFLAFVGKHAGYETTTVQEQIPDLYSAVYRQRSNNRTLPPWLDQLWPTTPLGPSATVYDVILDLKRLSRIMQFNSTDKARFRGGYLLRDIVHRFRRRNGGLVDPRLKMVIYSSHQGTLQALLYSLGIGNDMIIPYTATIFFEMYEVPGLLGGGYEVVVTYRNETNSEPYLMTIPLCPAMCPLEQLWNKYDDQMLYTEQQFDSMCGIEGEGEEKHVSHGTLVTLLGVACAVLLAMVVLLTLLLVTSKKSYRSISR